MKKEQVYGALRSVASLIKSKGEYLKLRNGKVKSSQVDTLGSIILDF